MEEAKEETLNLEEQRERNIRRNESFLANLGLGPPKLVASSSTSETSSSSSSSSSNAVDLAESYEKSLTTTKEAIYKEYVKRGFEINQICGYLNYVCLWTMHISKNLNVFDCDALPSPIHSYRISRIVQHWSVQVKQGRGKRRYANRPLQDCVPPML